jgi:uncharacterized membrane protein
MHMMKWMLLGCLALLLLFFMLPYFGVEGIQNNTGWLFFGLIFIICLLPMLLMNRKKDKDK